MAVSIDREYLAATEDGRDTYVLGAIHRGAHTIEAIAAMLDFTADQVDESLLRLAALEVVEPDGQSWHLVHVPGSRR